MKMNRYENARDAIRSAKAHYISELKSNKPFKEYAKPIYDGLCDAEKELDILEKYRNKVKEFLGETEWNGH